MSQIIKEEIAVSPLPLLFGYTADALRGQQIELAL
jgi:hypothetical protein